jgi:hypothetical protein
MSEEKKIGREGKSPLTLYIDEERHKKFKLACVEEGRPMTVVIEQLIDEWLTKRKGF